MTPDCGDTTDIPPFPSLSNSTHPLSITRYSQDTPAAVPYQKTRQLEAKQLTQSQTGVAAATQ